VIAITPPRRRYRVPGGKIEHERGGVWTLRRLVLAVTQKDPPPNDRGGGGIKKPERSGVWVAHRSFASRRPNKTVCGLHTASFASGGPNKTVCGLHTASLLFGRFNEPVCRVHTASLASSFPLVLPVPSSLPPHSHLSSTTPRSW